MRPAVPRRLASLAFVSLAFSGCQTTLAEQERYVGDIPACDGGLTHATLVVLDRHFSFAPSDGTLIVSGAVAEDGSFHGVLPLGRAASAREAPPALAVEGRITPEVATGSFSLPRCRQTFRLPLLPHSVLP
jgi:hypothetical protein